MEELEDECKSQAARSVELQKKFEETRAEIETLTQYIEANPVPDHCT
jgi:5-bromo-4-chloroindolyl phosphate hydrolysis protein